MNEKIKVGYIVVRTYGEGERPRGFVLGKRYVDGLIVRWFGPAMKEEVISARYLEVINESR